MKIVASFRSYTRERGYTLLPEVALNGATDTYFVMAPVAAYIRLFQYEQILQSPHAALVQRTLSCDRIDYTGEAPLANPCEVVAGYFRFADPSLSLVVGEALGALRLLLGADPAAFYVRSSDQLDFRTHLLEMGVPDDQIMVYHQPKQLSLGDSCPKGEYIFFYLRYRHGIIPVASIGVIPYQGRYATDSALFLERMTMIEERAHYPSGCSVFSHLSRAVQTSPLSASLDVAGQHLWMFLARAITLCLRDGIYPSHAYAGHYVKKMLRMMAYTAREVTLEPALVTAIMEAAVADCAALGYTLDSEVSQALARLVGERLLQYRSQIRSAFASIRGLAARRSITEEDAQQWAGRHGLRKHWLLDYLAEQGMPHSVRSDEREPIIGYAGYPFDDAGPVDVPSLFRRRLTRLALPTHGGPALKAGG